MRSKFGVRTAPAALGGGFRPGGKGPGGFRPGGFLAKPLLEALDADEDDKVTKAELVAVLLNCWRPNQYVFVKLNTSARN